MSLSNVATAVADGGKHATKVKKTRQQTCRNQIMRDQVERKKEVLRGSRANESRGHLVWEVYRCTLVPRDSED